MLYLKHSLTQHTHRAIQLRSDLGFIKQQAPVTWKIYVYVVLSMCFEYNIPHVLIYKNQQYHGRCVKFLGTSATSSPLMSSNRVWYDT
jgi:hypothetical protein